MMIPAPRSGKAEVTVTVTVDDTDPETFTADATTTGDPVTAACKLVLVVTQDASGRIDSRRDEERKDRNDAEGRQPGLWMLLPAPPPAASLRRAKLTATAVAGEHTKTIEADSTTRGNVYAAAAALVEAAQTELLAWLHTVYA